MNYSEESNNYRELATKWLDKSIIAEQEQTFNMWFNQGQDQPLFIPPAFAANAEIHKNRIYQKVLNGIEIDIQPVRKLWWRISSAVTLFIALSVVIYFYIQRPRHFNLNELADQYGRGSNVAVWFDENGKQVLLRDSVFKIPVKDGTRFTKAVAFSKIVTPRGARYKVVLEDGTKVWLGAASSLIYPTAFNGHERVVQLSGDAYFEVKHDSVRPFHVDVVTKRNRLDVEVTGTKFNVSGYSDDDEVKTWVFEGNVKVSYNGRSTALAKGEQVSLKKGQLLPKVRKPKKDWLWNNKLEFDNEDIMQVMHKISREYNVEITYSGMITDSGRLSGSFRYKDNLETVLNILEIATDYQFIVEGKTVIVSERDKGIY